MSEEQEEKKSREFKITLQAVERYGKVISYCALIIVAIFLVVNDYQNWLFILPLEAALLIVNAVKIWGTKTYRAKIVCYVFDTLILLALTYFTDGSLISTLYLIILSEFYLEQTNLAASLAMYIADTVLYLVMLALSSVLKGTLVSVGALLINAFNDLLLITLHFLIFNFAIHIFRKNKEITHALQELNKSNEKLQEAYLELQEVTALEERQRIAKEIHDTAGHSITTVIMQTEAAKLVIDTDPNEAKQRISAANLQAKHALEELRESVHLLSGIGKQDTLKGAILSIIHDSTDGTNIVIRSDVDEITLCDAKSRFILNTLKEGISNGLRHGGATAFWFELKVQGKEVRFLLSDNGRGMQISELKEGFGLSGMHRRAESLGGEVWFETEIDEGFEVHLKLPLDGGDYEN